MCINVIMPITEVMFKDKDGFHYKHPERSCTRCKNYPCLPNMDKLQGDFASYGCRKFEDINTFEVWKPKK